MDAFDRERLDGALSNVQMAALLLRTLSEDSAEALDLVQQLEEIEATLRTMIPRPAVEGLARWRGAFTKPADEQ